MVTTKRRTLTNHGCLDEALIYASEALGVPFSR
jgi:hypothetical protein